METSRGDCDADIPWRRVAAPPRLPRGHSAEASITPQVPALSRLRKLRQQARSEDDEERAALRLLVGVVVGYQAVVCGVCACCMRLVADEDTACEHGPASAGVNAWAWSAWTALSSFTNCGLTLQPGSWTRFRSARGALAFVAGTSFLGNALYFRRVDISTTSRGDAAAGT